MYLFEIFLPAQEAYGRLKEELVTRFGGLTAFTRTPAKGYWVESSGKTSIDEIVVLEVVAEEFEKEWWSNLKKRLERELNQKEILIRSSQIETVR